MIKMLSGNQYICTKTISKRFQLYARAYVRLWTLAPGFYNLVDQSKLDPVHASIIVLSSTEEMGVRLSSIYVLF